MTPPRGLRYSERALWHALNAADPEVGGGEIRVILARLARTRIALSQAREALHEADGYLANIESGPRKVTSDQELAAEARDRIRAALAVAA